MIMRRSIKKAIAGWLMIAAMGLAIGAGVAVSSAHAQSFYATDNYTGNGSTRTYAITFPYLTTGSLVVLVNGTPTVAYTLPTSSTLTFTTAPANGASITIERVTPVASSDVTFQPGGLSSTDMNTNQSQDLFGIQEISDQLQHAVMGQPSDFNLTLPTVSARANSILGFNGSGVFTDYPLSTFTGPTGPTGPTGATGSTGSTGPTGPAGTSIDWGTVAPTSGVGNNGDFYINTTTSCLYGPKAAGAWPGTCTSLIGPTGSTGSSGAPGSNGANGATIDTGSGVPSSGTGNNGDFYIDTAAWNIYGPKSGGVWGSGTSLIGPSGSGSGTVTTTGTPAAGNLAKFTSATAISNTDLTGDVTTSGGLATTLASTAVTPGAYTAANITVDAKGRVTAAANGSGGGTPAGSTGQIQYNNAGAFGGSAATITSGGTITIPTSNALSVPAGSSTTVAINFGTTNSGLFSNNGASGNLSLVNAGTEEIRFGLTTSVVQVASGYSFAWNASTPAVGSVDTSLCRQGAGVVEFGTSGCNASGTAEASQFEGNNSAFLTNPASATWHFGAADAASPTAQSLGVQGVVAGTTNTAGALWKFLDSTGTGTGGSGGFEWDTHPAGTTGSAQNAAASKMTLSSAGVLAVGGNAVVTTNDSRFGGPTQNSQSAAYTLVLADAGGQLYHPTADATARTWTIPANSSVAFPIGTKIDVVNDCSAGVLTIAITTDTLVLFPAGTTGSRTLAACGEATLTKVTPTRWISTGPGLT